MSSVIDDARRGVALAMAVREMDGVVETLEEDGETMVSTYCQMRFLRVSFSLNGFI
jgi:hypothetical protein